MDWPERSKHWFFTHGGKLDPQTGHAIYARALAEPAERLIATIEASSSGEFVPNREKDELTHTL